MKKAILFIATHPDDETIGCGGTILKHKAAGDGIYWLIATSTKKEYGYSNKAVIQRKREIKSVADAYGFNKVYQLGLPTTRVDSIPMRKIIKEISEIFNEVKPEIVYLPFRADVHSDHRIIFEAAYSCTKQFRYPFIKKILMMEVLSETEFAPSMKELTFIPNLFVNISDYLDKKLAIMKIYKDELGSSVFPRSLKNIKALAAFRGAMAGCKFAEAFVVLKEMG